MNDIKNDLPFYINGFVVTHLFLSTQCDWVDLLMFVLAVISFFWGGANQRRS